MISEETYDHLHGIIAEPTEADRLSKGAEQIATITTNQPIAGILQFFRNHETDQMDILVEDSGNQLSLFSNKGSMFWTKQLDSQISGKVHEVDLFKNGNKQVAFSTGFQLEVLDRKGRRKSVLLPLREYEDLLEDLHDLAVIAERRDETPRSLAEVRQNLTRDHVL